METAEKQYDVVYFAEGSDPLSLMASFATSDKGIKIFVDRVANQVRDGLLDPLKVAVFMKTFEKIKEGLDEKIKANYNSEAAKYGDKPFEHCGAIIHFTNVNTRYDYSGCNHPRWNGLTKIIKEATERRGEIEDTLRPLKESFTMVDDDSGEVVTVRPPMKTSTDGIKIKIK